MLLEIAAGLGAISGLAGIVYLLDYFGVIRPRHATVDSQRKPTLFPMLVILALTWLAITADFIDRHRQLPPQEISYAPLSSTEINRPSAFGPNPDVLYYAFPELDWPVHKLKVVRDKSFVNATLPLDGYVYINCSFANVTFQYDGTDLTGGWVDARKLDGIRIQTNEAHLMTLIALIQSSGLIPPDYCPASSTPPPAMHR